MNKIKTTDLFEKSGIPFIDDFVFTKEYPWELLPSIKSYCLSLLDNGIDGYSYYKDNVLIGRDVKIASTAIIIGPCILGNGVEVRPGAYIRGSVIVGDESVVGNSSELKNCILMRHAQVPHYNYVGDSILGNFAHMGAGSICSNLKSDGKNIIIHGEINYETGLRKIGGILADHADIGCGSVLNPGTIVGKNTQIYPLTMARGVYPDNCIVKSTKEIIKKI